MGAYRKNIYIYMCKPHWQLDRDLREITNKENQHTWHACITENEINVNLLTLTDLLVQTSTHVNVAHVICI